MKSTLPTEKHKPLRRQLAEYYVTLVSLNDTFNTKHIKVPYFPETCKLGRPTGAKVKPNSTNGYFDSRVLSRNHACMFVDSLSGKLYIQDMGSSNGTFVNLEKISTEAVIVKVGDTINLGFNIQVETNHKQISAKVEAINIMSNTPKSAVLTALPGLTHSVIDSFSDSDLKHYEFMLKFLSQIFGEVSKDPAATSEVPGDSPSDLSSAGANTVIENAMFGDLIPTMDSAVYRLKPTDAGFFDNSNIVYSPELQSSLDQLTLNLVKIKQQSAALKSLETVLTNYSSKVTEINSKFLQQEMEKSERATAEAEKALKSEQARSAKLISDHEHKLRELQRLLSALKDETSNLRAENDELRIQHDLDLQRKFEHQLTISPQQSPIDQDQDIENENGLRSLSEKELNDEDKRLARSLDEVSLPTPSDDSGPISQPGTSFKNRGIYGIITHPLIVGMGTAAVLGIVFQQYNK